MDVEELPAPRHAMAQDGVIAWVPMWQLLRGRTRSSALP
jgi:hypothetical protein